MITFSLQLMLFTHIQLFINANGFFYRNDNIEKSIENYREAFDVVYLVSLQSDDTSSGLSLSQCNSTFLPLHLMFISLVSFVQNDASMWGVVDLVSQLCPSNQ